MSDLAKKYTPLNGCCLVEPKTVQAGSLVVPENANKKPQIGYIRLISQQDDINENGITFKCLAKEGDLIHYRNWNSDIINDSSNKDLVTVKFRDIDLIINE